MKPELWLHSSGLVKAHSTSWGLPLFSIYRSTAAFLRSLAALHLGKVRMGCVLVVDDCADCVAAIRILLQLHGHEVRGACCGCEALQLCDTFSPDVAFLNVMMPEMDGYELAHHLRQRFAGVRLIAITGLPPLAWRATSPFECHLLKPVTIDLLLKFLK